MSERWRCVTTNKLTFAQEPESNELLLAQVGDLCGKHSALITKRNEGRHSLLFAYSGSMMGKKQFTRGSSQKAQVSNSSMGMDELESDGKGRRGVGSYQTRDFTSHALLGEGFDAKSNFWEGSGLRM